MEEVKDKIADIGQHVEDVAGTFYKLAVVNATKKAVDIGSAGITTIIIAVAGIFFLLFSGLALGWWLGNVVNNRAAGFLLAGVFFLLIMFVVLVLRKKTIIPFLRDFITRKLYD